LHESQIAEDCQLVDLGETVQGRDMSLLVIGQPDEDKKNIWVTARQHPGETMAEWYIEGLLNRLLDDEDGTAKALLEKAVFYVVPNMNPDGSVLGNLRTNAAGRNLNREWQTPSLEESPEVYLVREKMLATGVDMFLDIHGDEAIPYNFVAGCEGIPSYDERHKDLEDSFKAAYALITPEFQDVHTYPKDEPGKANMTVACTWVGERFNCLAYTVEMPFKDNHDLPDAVYGWSDVRSMKFGHDVLPAILAVVDKL
jgi:murein tripeptide amidase MpaA